MPRQSKSYRRIWTLAGLIAAAALVVRGVVDLGAGSGGQLLLVAAALVTAIVLRWKVYPD